MHILNLLFSFHGRANRAQYWLGNLGAGFLGTLAIFFAAFIVAPHNGVKPDPFAQTMLTLGAFAPIMLAMAWAGVAIQVKRFHDRGRSGWFALARISGSWATTSQLFRDSRPVENPPCSSTALRRADTLKSAPFQRWVWRPKFLAAVT